MRFFFLFFLLINFSYAEKLYERTYPTIYLSERIAGESDEEDKSILEGRIRNKLQFHLEKYLKKKVNGYSDKTRIEVDDNRGRVKITSILHTMYQVENLIGNLSTDASQVKVHFTVYELKDNSKLLKMNPLDVNPKLLRSLPSNEARIISEGELITQNGQSASLSNKNDYFSVTPQVDPDGYNIEVEMRCMLNSGTYEHDTRFKCIDRSELAFQIQSKNKQGRNLYLVVSTVLLDYDLKPISRFTNKEVEGLKKEIAKNEKKNLGLFTQFYTISVAIPSGLEDHKPNDEPPPDFKKYFESMGVKFTEGSSVKFVQAAMRIVIHATEETHLQIEKVLQDIGIETPQRKLLVRLVEIDNSDLAKLEGESLTIKKTQKFTFKVLENFETFAVSGKTARIAEGDIKSDDPKVSIDITSQSNIEDTETHIDLQFKYSKNRHDFSLDKSLTLKNGSDQFFELQKTKAKTIFLIVYADKYIPETEFWYSR